MHRRTLGATGIEVPILGMGSSPFRHAPAERCSRLLEQAMQLGVNYYDTARSYVNGEEAVSHLPPDLRNRLVIATKTGARGGKHCLVDLQRSLRTTQRSWIDVWMAHMIATESEYEMCTALGGFCDIALAAKQAGLVRAIGASFHAHTELILRAINEKVFDVVMFPFNLIGRETVFGSSIASYRDQLLPAARDAGVAVVVMKVLAGGELKHGAPRLQFATDPSTGRDTVGGSVRYAAMHPGISVAVVGMASTSELARNVSAVAGVDDSYATTAADWSTLASALRGPCTRCGACLNACPQGIEIPKVMRLYDQSRYLGMGGVASTKYQSLSIDASACTHCGECQAVCPEPFDIARELAAAHAALGPQTSGAS